MSEKKNLKNHSPSPDVQAEDDNWAFLENIKKLSALKTEKKQSVQVRRELRGYTA